MQIKLSDHFTYGRLLRYTLPTIVMIIFTSLYSVVDGLFVSNLVGDLALSAVNIAFPITMIIGAFGFMLGTGGSAIVARTLGEGKPELASRYFTLFIWCVAGLGVVLSIVTIAFIEPIMRFAGASDLLLEDCIAYGRILLAGSAVFMLQSAFQSFFSVAEKPKLGLLLSLAAGATNITFDYVFIALLGMGVTGAAWATVLGYCVGGVIPVVYFLLPRREGLRLVRTNFYGRELLHACINGSSELMSNISASVVGILYNIRLMDLLGEPGVAAHSVMMYVDFVFVAAFLGFSMGSAPIVSYHYGAENYDELKNIFRRSGVIIAATSVAMVAASELLSRPLSAAFVGYSPDLLELTTHGFRIFALCYLFCGLNIYASAFFTALCNGALSALIAFTRTLLLRGGLSNIRPRLSTYTGGSRMMKETPPTLTLEATTFNKPQLQEQLSVLEQRQEAQIALAGRSNVGKSSLVNALARRKQLAKISATPGKTRSINFYRGAPDGFSLVDLPGYGYAKCSQEERKSWAKLIEYYLTNTPTLKALALLLDCRIPPQALDRDLADFARGHGIPLLPVLTKADKCTQVERSKRQQEWSRLLNGIMPLPVSSKDMRGVDALWSELRRFAGTGESVSEEE